MSVSPQLSSRPGTTNSRSRPLPGRKFLLLLGVLLVVGSLSTAAWLGSLRLSPENQQELRWASLGATFLIVPFTLANLLLRWFRWHFLIRRFTPDLLTRDSFVVFWATLPAIVSPFLLAELGRVFLIRRRYQTPASYLVRVWLGERFMDAAFLAVTLAICREPSWAWLATGLALLLSVFLGRRALQARSWGHVVAVTLGSWFVTALAWSLPIFALALGVRQLGGAISFSEAAAIFSESTLFGGVSGLPLGVSVVGSTMISGLVNAGVDAPAAVLSTLAYRAGTAWFAVLAGFVAMFLFRKRLLRIVRGESSAHFDEIAHEYEDEIPVHVRDRLLGKKVQMMAETLASLGIPKGARGLDLGCGQGWYLAEMNLQGFRVDGTDYSEGQLTRAERHLGVRGILVTQGQPDDTPGLKVFQADAQNLPIPDASYDFVYSINAIHHILAPGAQERALHEVVRILKPGGVFILHEMNTFNPVFRWYMGYLFPLLKKIDEGNEEWVLPTSLPRVAGAHWDEASIRYFTFLPDFIPGGALRLLAPLERLLENSPLRRMSAHYQASLHKGESA